MAEFAQYLINGLSQGGTYALIALGYTMVFGILQLINFAHGEVYMLGAFTGMYTSKFAGAQINGFFNSLLNGAADQASTFSAILTAIVIIIVAMIVCALVGFCVQAASFIASNQSIDHSGWCFLIFPIRWPVSFWFGSKSLS